MTNRMKAMSGMLLYLLFNSVFFGSMFSKKYMMVGLAFGLLAQGVAVGLLFLIQRTEHE